MTEAQLNATAAALRRYGLYGGESMSRAARQGKRKRYEAMVLANGPASTKELARRVDALIRAEMLGLTAQRMKKRRMAQA